MSDVDGALLKKLTAALKVSDRRINQLIAQIASERHLTRQQAAIVLAGQRRVNVSRLSAAEDLAAIRAATNASAPVQVITVPRPLSPSVKGTKSTKKKAGQAKPEKRRGNSVFVVHGRDERLRRSLFQFLRAVGLNPIEWRKAIKLTGKGTPYVGEILDAAFTEAVAIVVLFTPDDEARLKTEFLAARDGKEERQLTGQARPNVLFEAGMAFGRNPNATILVQIGDLRGMSDIAGRHVVHLSESPESRQDLVTRLMNAGCNVDTEGKTDWLTEGDFSAE